MNTTTKREKKGKPIHFLVLPDEKKEKGERK
jgi:hypothetical protein